MNIKTIYPVFASLSIISVVFRVLQLLFGTDNISGLRNPNSPFSWLFALILAVFCLILFVIPKISYGTSKVSEIYFPKALAPASIILSVCFLGDIFLSFQVSSATLFKLESVFGVLSAAAFLIFALILLEKLSSKLLPVLLFPVFYFILKLVGLFLTDVSISNHPIASLNLVKSIFMLLFYISFASIFFKENPGEKISNAIFISLSSAMVTLCGIVSNFFLVDFEIKLSDIAFCIFSLMVSVILINAVVKTSKSIKE